MPTHHGNSACIVEILHTYRLYQLLELKRILIYVHYSHHVILHWQKHDIKKGAHFLMTHYHIKSLALTWHLEIQMITNSLMGQFSHELWLSRGTWWRSWLRHCATSRKVAGSIPDGVIEIFHWQSFQPHYSPGVDSTSNRNEYQEYFLGVKAAGV